jgi:pimeloyl-ACP methyl ester carboxylesterase
MVTIEPYAIDVPQEVLDDIRERLRRTRWPNEIPGSGWARGTDLSFMKNLVAYWLDEYDWRKEEARLNAFDHFKADVDGLGIHFIREEGKGPDPMPLFMMHGYPWSFTMLLKIMPMLTDPAAYGGDPADAFTVVAPSLIGFGLSDPPRQLGFGFQHHPAKYDKLMTEGLGYRRYGIEGGDWGGTITAPFGFLRPDNLIGIHLNFLYPRIGDERPPEEKDPDILRGFGMRWAPLKPTDPDLLRYWKNVERYWIDEGAYAHVQQTRPQTLSYAITDSPAGMAAWIVEKWRAWSGWGDDFEKLFSKDMIITNVMLYWVSNSFWSAIRLYSESYHNPWELQPGERIEVPTAVAAYPHELIPIARKRAERYYNVVRFTEFPKGGHFAIYERAEEMADDLRGFFRPLRQKEKARMES